MKKFLSTVLGKIVVFGGGALLIGGIVLAVVLGNRTQDYRVIKVYRIDGKAEVMRSSLGTVTPYENMLLQNGDRGRTLEDGYLYLNMDDDKFALAEPETEFTLEASGTAEKSRTVLMLESGALVYHITQPLSDDSSFEVTTPNSTMAIRGTSFRVLLLYDKAGVSHTYLEVFEGTVEIHLKQPDGTIDPNPVYVKPGQRISVWGDVTESDYDGEFDTIDYYSFDVPTLEFLKLGADELDGYDVSIPEVDDIIETKQSFFDVKFMVDGRLFGKQSVLFDTQASEPKLQPTEKGFWKFDFNTPIREETVIEWVEE